LHATWHDIKTCYRSKTRSPVAAKCGNEQWSPPSRARGAGNLRGNQHFGNSTLHTHVSKFLGHRRRYKTYKTSLFSGSDGFVGFVVSLPRYLDFQAVRLMPENPAHSALHSYDHGAHGHRLYHSVLIWWQSLFSFGVTNCPQLKPITPARRWLLPDIARENGRSCKAGTIFVSGTPPPVGFANRLSEPQHRRL
jgi:hypothetical protein